MSQLEISLNNLIYQAERRNAELARELFRAERLAVAYQRLSALNAEAERAVSDTMAMLSQEHPKPQIKRVA